MRYLKMLGVAAVAIAALMAIVGAGSASATTLCLNNTLPCAESEWKKEVVKGVSTDAKFTGGLFTQSCKTNTAETEVKSVAGTGKASVPVATLSFTKECSPCKKVVATTESVTLGFTTGTMNGVAEGNGHAVFSECTFGAECQFGGSGVKFEVKGSATAAEVIANTKLKLEKGSAFLCGSEGTFTAHFTGVTEKDRMAFVST